MEEIRSNSEDVMLLAKELKCSLDNYVSFNFFGIDNEILTGVYLENGTGKTFSKRDGVRFYIKFCKEQFLRIQIPQLNKDSKDVYYAMDALVNSISKIHIDGINLGFPLAIYIVDGTLACEYPYRKKKQTIRALKENTLFNDSSISDLHFLKNCSNCNLSIYGQSLDTGEKKLYCTNGGVESDTLPSNICADHEQVTGAIPNLLLLSKKK